MLPTRGQVCACRKIKDLAVGLQERLGMFLPV